MKTLKSICLLLLVMISYTSVAQSDVIIIDRKNYKQKKDRDIKLNENTQVIKFAPLHMLAGEINFGYERQMSQKGSLDFEFGPTISNIGFGLNSHFVDPFQPSTIENSALGLMIGAGYRYYPLDETEALNRFYVGPVLKYKLMNSIYEDGSGFINETRKGNTSMMNFYFNFGYQVWLAKSFSMDLYCGFGIGVHQHKRFNAVQEFIDNEWQYEWQEVNNSGAVYVGNIGIKVGIGSK